MDINQLQEQIFRAIDIITEEKLNHLKYNQCVEVIILSDTQNDDGSYPVLYQDLTLTAFPQGAVTYKKDEIAYMLLVNNDLSTKKILISGKSLKQDTVTAEHNHDDRYYTKSEIDIKISTYVHTQSVASISWSITHNLNKYPDVTIVDSAGSVVMGDIKYNSENAVTITFSAPFSGKAYLN